MALIEHIEDFVTRDCIVCNFTNIKFAYKDVYLLRVKVPNKLGTKRIIR